MSDILHNEQLNSLKNYEISCEQCCFLLLPPFFPASFILILKLVKSVEKKSCEKSCSS